MKTSLILLLATAWVGWASDVELRAALPAFCTDATTFAVADICEEVGLTTGPAGCPALQLLGNIATATQPPKCRSSSTKLGGIVAPPHEDSDGTVLPQDLPDVRSDATGSLPEDLNQRAYMQAEGSTYFWYYRQLQSLANYAPCTKSAANADVEMPAPKGWDIVGFFNAPPVAGLPPSDTLPFAMLLKPEPSYSHKRRDSCKRWYSKAAQDLEASIAETDVEAQGEHHHKHNRDDYDSSYNKHHNGGDDSYKRHHGGKEYEQDRGYGWNHRHYHNEHYSCGKDESEGTSPHMVLLLRGTLTVAEWATDLIYSQLYDRTYGPGKISAGFYTQAESLWKAGLGATIEREIARGCKSITIAGHSLGAAVAQLLAVRIEALLATDEYRKTASVTVVTFGSPAVGDEKWAENFDAKINARQLAYEGDGVAQVPCDPRIVDCTNPAANPPVFWYYKRTGGNVILPGVDMPFDATAWTLREGTSGVQLCDSNTLIPTYATGHVCSYMCATSRYVDVTNNLCWISTLQPPAGASLCDFTPPQ